MTAGGNGYGADGSVIPAGLDLLKSQVTDPQVIGVEHEAAVDVDLGEVGKTGIRSAQLKYGRGGVWVYLPLEDFGGQLVPLVNQA